MSDAAPVTIHDWTRGGPGAWHDFHYGWIAEIRRQLNGGLLPDRYYALAEPQGGFAVAGDGGEGPEEDGDADDPFGGRRFEGDLLTLHHGDRPAEESPSGEGGIAVAERPPRATVTAPLSLTYRGPRRIAVRHRSGDRTVALVEIASPGNRTGVTKINAFCDKIEAALRGGVHVVLADLFPPTPLLPAGLVGEIADRFDATYEPPNGEPLAVASYRSAGEATTSFVEPLRPGDPPPTVPLFLSADRYINLPLADGYAAAFAASPRHLRASLTAG